MRKQVQAYCCWLYIEKEGAALNERVKEEEGDGSELEIERVWSRVLLGMSLRLRDRFEIVAVENLQFVICIVFGGKKKDLLLFI